MMEDPRAIAARGDAQRRFVVQRGTLMPRASIRQRTLCTAASEVILRIAPMRAFNRISAQTIIIAAGFGLGIVEHDGPEKFRVVDQYKLGSASR